MAPEDLPAPPLHFQDVLHGVHHLVPWLNMQANVLNVEIQEQDSPRKICVEMGSTAAQALVILSDVAIPTYFVIF